MQTGPTDLELPTPAERHSEVL
uniref:Uncharacterized protein n=1 Tax=Anguilla anguilla TaxID=7936 RepID=A0A0E9VAC2_ANGAN